MHAVVPTSEPLPAGRAGVGVHRLAVLSFMAAIAAIVYEWIGFEACVGA
jgi:hypothetical protein